MIRQFTALYQFHGVISELLNSSKSPTLWD